MSVSCPRSPGGVDNTASGDRSAVSGGEGNTASGAVSIIGGGYLNDATGVYSTVGGGYANNANGLRSTVPGGTINTAAGISSFAAGTRAQANHDGAFVWADDQGLTTFESTAANQFLIRASGGVGIGTDSPDEALTVAGTIHTTAGGIKFPDNTVQITAAVGGGVGPTGPTGPMGDAGPQGA